MLIQKLRLQRGWSQEQLAELSGLSVRTIQRIENGKPASAESLKSLASVFEIEFSMLLPKSVDSIDSAKAAQASPEESKVDNFSIKNNPLMQGVSREEALALRHVRAVRGFYIHAAQYAAVIPVLAVINLLTSPNKLWFFYPALGWGLGLTFHALAVFNKSRFFGADWEKRQVEKILKRPL